MNQKHKLNFVEFYITNVCNFNCNDCNRFNNFNFTGHQSWDKYKSTYMHWSQVLDISRFAIIGGEPMTNPSHVHWLQGVLDLWPNAYGSIATNGSLLNRKNRDLYTVLKNNKSRAHMDVSSHNRHTINALLDKVIEWLDGPVTIKRLPENILDIHNFTENFIQSYNIIKNQSWPMCHTLDDWYSLPQAIRNECAQQHNFSPEIIANDKQTYEVIDSNGVKVILAPEWFFQESAVIPLSKKSMTLRQSDPEIAHQVCQSKYCHQFDRGGLYKCSQVSLFRDLDQQFHLDISTEDRELIYQYTPASPDMPYDELTTFINNLAEKLPQCKFCTERAQGNEIFASTGKTMIFYKKDQL